MKTITFFLMLFILTQCASITDISNLLNTNDEFLKTIPKRSEIVYVSKNCTKEQLFSEIEDVLLKRNHRIATFNKEKFYINTDNKDLGYSTNQRMNIVIYTENNLSIAKLTAEWMPGTESSILAGGLSGIAFTPQWSKAYGGLDKPGIAFAEAAVIANNIVEGNVYFEKPKQLQ